MSDDFEKWWSTLSPSEQRVLTKPAAWFVWRSCEGWYAKSKS